MEIIIVSSQAEGAEKSFQIFKEAYQKGARTYGLATGSSPEGLYQHIVESDLDFSQATSVNLDEYVGISKDNPQSYYHFMKTHLFEAKPFKESFLPDGLAADPDAEVARYDRILAEHPVDFQLLGIGTNAHIGFNEPGTPFSQRTHKVQLAEATIQANKRFFERVEDVPTQAYSMGLANIMEAKQILLVAYGPKKAQAIYNTVKGPITTDVPASILQKHPHVTLILDQEAAALL